jgi:hypothetical protein
VSGPLADWAGRHTAAPNQATRLVLLALALRARHDGGGANLTRDELREFAGLGKASDTAVKRSLRWLRDNHEVDEPHGSRGGHGRATVRRVLIRWCQGACWSCEVLAEAIRVEQDRAARRARGSGGLDPVQGGTGVPPSGRSREGKGGTGVPPTRRRRGPKGGTSVPPSRRPATASPEGGTGVPPNPAPEGPEARKGAHTAHLGGTPVPPLRNGSPPQGGTVTHPEGGDRAGAGSTPDGAGAPRSALPAALRDAIEELRAEGAPTPPADWRPPTGGWLPGWARSPTSPPAAEPPAPPAAADGTAG